MGVDAGPIIGNGGHTCIRLDDRRKRHLLAAAEKEGVLFIEPFNVLVENRERIFTAIDKVEIALRTVLGNTLAASTPEVRKELVMANTIRECRDILNEKTIVGGSATTRLQKLKLLVNDSASHLLNAFQSIDSSVTPSRQEGAVVQLQEYVERRRVAGHLDALNNALKELSDQLFELEHASAKISEVTTTIDQLLTSKIQGTEADAARGNLGAFLLNNAVQSKLQDAQKALQAEGGMVSLNDCLNEWEEHLLAAAEMYLKAVEKGEVRPSPGTGKR